MPRTLLVEGLKTFRVTIPDTAHVTFGPFSPPASTKDGGRAYAADTDKKGTLRIYDAAGSNKNVLAVFSNVNSFRDISQIDYAEQVAVEEGTKIWKTDAHGYEREEKVSRTTDWVDPTLALSAPAEAPAKRSRRKASA